MTTRSVSPEDERTIRAFYDETWNKHDPGGFKKHPTIAAECSRTMRAVSAVFSSIRIRVKSLEQHDKEVWVHWSAEGTRAITGAKNGRARQTATGLTRMTLQGGEIVSAKASWEVADSHAEEPF